MPIGSRAPGFNSKVWSGRASISPRLLASRPVAGAVVLAVVALMLLGGCVTRTVPPMRSTGAEPSVQHFVGTTLSGPIEKSISAGSPQEAMSIRVSFLAVERLPADFLEPLGAQARLIVSERGGDAVLPTTSFTQKARLGQGKSAEALLARLSDAPHGRTQSITELTGVLPAGVTASFRLTDPAPIQELLTEETVRRRVAIDVHRKDPAIVGEQTGRLEVAVTLQDLLAPNEPAAPTPDAAAAPPARGSAAANGGKTGRAAPPTTMPAAVRLQKEIAVFDGPEVASPGFLAVLVPFSFASSGTEGVVALIETRPGTADPVHARRLAEAVRESEQAAAAVASQRLNAPQRNNGWAGLNVAISSLGRPPLRRAALVFLSSEGSARFCGDVALVADDTVLADLADYINGSKGTLPVGGTRAELGWALDLATLTLLSNLQGAGKLPRELASVLVNYTGEAGRHTSSLEEILNQLSSRPELERRLLAENQIYLEDSQPGARLRAYEWLRARDAAPEGYDPLAPGRERRAALERAARASDPRNAATAPATSPATRPATQPATQSTNQTAPATRPAPATAPATRPAGATR